MHTAESLKNDLKHSGFVSTDTVLIHSSMKSIGEVDGGAETVLDALTEFFSDGLLVLPAFSYDTIRPDREKIFYPEITPACTGILTELFRKRPGVKRSMHPLHSLSALGKDADDFVAGHEKYNTSFDQRSPWGRLASRNAKLLFIGVTLDCATYFHALEQWAQVDVLSAEPLELYVENGAGEVVPVPVYWHTGAHSEQYHLAENPLKKAGLIRFGKFGDADTRVLDCVSSQAHMIDLLKKNPKFFEKRSNL